LLFSKLAITDRIPQIFNLQSSIFNHLCHKFLLEV